MFDKFLFRVFVGIGAVALFGGLDALVLMLAAILCSIGVGLIVVLPALYLVGLVCTIWFIPFGAGAWRYSKKAKAEGSEPKPTRRVSSQVALAKYIASAEVKGQDWETIKADLIQSGWQAKTVINARPIDADRAKARPAPGDVTADYGLLR